MSKQLPSTPEALSHRSELVGVSVGLTVGVRVEKLSVLDGANVGNWVGE